MPPHEPARKPEVDSKAQQLKVEGKGLLHPPPPPAVAQKHSMDPDGAVAGVALAGWLHGNVTLPGMTQRSGIIGNGPDENLEAKVG